MRVGRASAPARAALAGNPSDGYGGATLAVALGNHSARAEAVPAPAPAPGPVAEPPSRLVEAAVRRFARDHGPAAGRVRVRWATDVPREVGLGGSSAIVTATLRALSELHHVELAPDVLAETALAVEVEDLGIPAGLQDRVAQAYGGLSFMDFAPGRPAAGRYEQLDPDLLPELFVAFRPDAATASGAVHGDLRARFEAGETAVHAAMAELAELAWGARAALLGGDHAGFARCLDATFDVRRRLVPLDPRHVALIDRARAAGAAANYTGSGGAIVGLWGPRPAAVRTALEAVGARCFTATISRRRPPRRSRGCRAPERLH